MAFNPDRNSTATSTSSSTPQIDTTTKLLENISNIDKAEIESSFSKHHVAIKTVFYVSVDYPEILVLYCAVAMEMESKEITAQALLDECERLLDVIPETVLLQMMNNFGDISLAGLEMCRKSEKTMIGACGLEKPSGVLTDGSVAHSSTIASSGNIENHRKVKTDNLLNDVIGKNTSTFDQVNGAHSAHAQSRPEYEDEVDRVSVSPIPNYHFENSDSGSRNGAAKHAPSLPPLKNQIKQTERQSFQDDGTKSLGSKERLKAVTRENEILETSLMCVECKVRPRGLTFLPCGHFLVCAPCSVGVYVCSACDTRVLGEVATSTVSHIETTP